MIAQPIVEIFKKNKKYYVMIKQGFVLSNKKNVKKIINSIFDVIHKK